MRLIRLFGAALAGALLFTLGALPASALLLIEIDKSSQQMTVSRDGREIYVWPMSSGLARYDTPSGSYTPFRMEKDHFSREWDDAPMPHSIFFTQKGHAIHGTDHARNLGRPASHGCVRLSRANASMLWDLVKREGMANTRVVLSGQVPAMNDPAVSRRAPTFGEQPAYANDDVTAAPPARGFFESDQPRDVRGGYWATRPDGSRVFYDRERSAYPPPPPPPPFFFPRPPGW
jgi:hypothetical protein